MENQPLDAADKFALQELFNFAINAAVPDHNRTVVDTNEAHHTVMIKRHCPGSGQPATNIHLDHVGHKNIPATIHGLCSEHCHAFLKWGSFEHRWSVEEPPIRPTRK